MGARITLVGGAVPLDAETGRRLRQHAGIVRCRARPARRRRGVAPHRPGGRRDIAERRQIALNARTTTDLDDALDGAEFVVSAFSVGGFASMRHDIEIPTATGCARRWVTAWPGGVSRALRSVPVIVDVARAMERRCLTPCSSTSPTRSPLCASASRRPRFRPSGCAPRSSDSSSC